MLMIEKIARQNKIYEKMISRIERKSKISNYLLIYYSIVLIAYSLVAFIFSKAVNPYTLPFYNIMISVTMLIFSVVNNLANYQERLEKIKKSKQALGKLEIEAGYMDLKDVQSKYVDIVENTEKALSRDIISVDDDRISFYGVGEFLLYILLIIAPLYILSQCVNWNYIDIYYLSTSQWKMR